jgi:hypothetical protein
MTVITFQDLLEALNRLPMVTIHPTSLFDFRDYSQLMKDLYWTLSGHIKMNHIFLQMTFWKINLMEHGEFVFNLLARRVRGMVCLVAR